MGFLKITKTAKHQRFNYSPRYYDPKKEDLQRRLEIAQGKVGGGTEATKERISAALRRSRSSNPKLRSKYVFRSNMLLLGIIVVLIVGLFVLLNVYLPQIEQMMSGGAR